MPKSNVMTSTKSMSSHEPKKGKKAVDLTLYQPIVSAVNKFMEHVFKEHKGKVRESTWTKEKIQKEFLAVLASSCRPPRERKLKDPKAPKPPLTGYNRFVAEKRAEVKRENPNMSPREIFGLVSKMWQALPPAKKSKYQTAYETEKAKYDKLKEEYKKHAPSREELMKLPENQPKVRKSRGKGKSKPKDPHAPKRPANAFIHFRQKRFAELKAKNDALPEKKRRDTKAMVEQLRAEWKEGGDEVDHFKELAKDLMEKYKKAMAKYKEEHPELDDKKDADDEESKATTKKATSKASSKSTKKPVDEDENDENDEDSDDEEPVSKATSKASKSTKKPVNDDDEPASPKVKPKAVAKDEDDEENSGSDSESAGSGSDSEDD